MLPPTDDRAALLLFAHVAARPEESLDLARAALMIAEVGHPQLDVSRWMDELDRLGERARDRVAALPADRRTPVAVAAVEEVLALLYRDLGFHGNEADYGDPRNSFLPDVLERRTGIPISLALVLTEVARRAGVEARGVGFPGHFLVRLESDDGPRLIDPFLGRLLDGVTLRAIYARFTGRDAPPPPHLLEPATKRQILVRMLGNLRNVYVATGDKPNLRAVLSRMEVLAPSPELRRQIELLGGGEPPGRSGGHAAN